MLLPERTVDAWTAAYITGRQWRARIWAPTERTGDEKYDLAVGLKQVGRGETYGEEPDKVFVLEHKGVTAGSKVEIRIKQLKDHLAADAALSGGLVYYLLPALMARNNQTPHRTWSESSTAPVGRIPGAAAHRLQDPQTLISGGGRRWPSFARAAVVISVTDLDAAVGKTSAKKRAIPINDLWQLNNAESLADFVSNVCECRRGRIWDKDLAEAVDDVMRDPPVEQSNEKNSTAFYGLNI